MRGSDIGDVTCLLAVAWVTIESKLLHRKSPWLLGGDETFWTNAKKRPFAWICGMNTHNEIVLFVNAFIPSAQKWLFYWLWTDAPAQLLDGDALKSTKMILVDQNKKR